MEELDEFDQVDLSLLDLVDHVLNKGVVLEDGPGGTTWRRQ